MPFDAGRTALREPTLSESRALDRFLASVERKAFRIAQIALRHDEDALDAVQDAMLRLARGYGSRPEPEWRPLFYRILENCIRDMQRRRQVRARVMAFTGWGRSDGDEPVADPIEQAPDPGPDPEGRARASQSMQALEGALGSLPARQRQAFLLRTLEGLDVADTARAMDCSEGSVKTHYFRAVQALRLALGEHWP